MFRPAERGARVAVAALALLPALTADAYGPQGHLIAGRVAAGFLCREAAAEVGRLAVDETLDELGLWADRIRGNPEYAGTAPWHYMNIDDGAPLAAYRSPPEGDVLAAIARYYDLLADDADAAHAARAEALRFLVHFVVDLHQPLHVGRAADRGGNAIDVIAGGERLNLHRFWDTEAITTAGPGTLAYARAIADDVVAALPGATFEPRQWAAESLALRDRVYAFDPAQPLSEAYLADARALTRERLTLAAARLAVTLNSLFCE